MSDEPIPAGTDASAWAGQIGKPWKVEVIEGRPIWCHTPPFLELLAAGQVPQELEAFVLWEDFHGSSYKIVGGKVQRKSDVEVSIEQAERWKNKLRVAARAMDWPRLRLKGEPNYAAGEVGPNDLLPAEINEIAFIAAKRSVPPLPEMFQEPPAGSVDGGQPEPDLRPGEPVPHEAEPIDRTDGE